MVKLTEVINDLHILMGDSVAHNIHKIEHIDSKRKEIRKRKKVEDRYFKKELWMRRISQFQTDVQFVERDQTMFYCT